MKKLPIIVTVVSLISSCIPPAGTDDLSHLTFVASRVFGPQGGTWELKGANPEVRWFRMEVPAGALASDTEISLYLSSRLPNPPKNFVSLHHPVEIRPKGLAFAADVVVLLPYDDADQDGIIDGTGIPEADIYPAYYDEGSASWGPLNPLVPDPDANVAACYANHLSPFMLWGAERSADANPVSPATGMHVIWLDWIENPLLDEAAAAATLSQHGIGKLFAHVYSPDESTAGRGILECSSDGHALPQGITGTRDCFSLDTLLAQAHARGIEVIVNLSCFSAALPDDPAHASHLLEVIDYFVRSYPGIDGIMLDYIRFSEFSPPTTPSFANIDAVTRFVRELKQEHAGRLPVYLNLFIHGDSARELLLGQRYADLAGVADWFCPMLYGGPVYSPEKTASSTLRTVIARNDANGLKVMPLIQTYDPISPEQIEGQIVACLQCRPDGVGFFRLGTTSDPDWSVIDPHMP